MEKPDVDLIEGLSPAISIEQKATSHNPRSTVGTVTEIHDYLRLLYARVGTPYCPEHALPLEAQSVAQMVDHVLALPEDTKLMILAPVVAGRKGEQADLFAELRAQGFVRLRVDGKVHDIDALPKLAKNVKHTIDVVVDRLKVRADAKQRLAESFETALRHADGRAIAVETDTRQGAPVLGQVRLPGLQLFPGRARAAAVLVQQSHGRLPEVRRPGRDRVLRSAAAWSRTRTCRSPAARSRAGTGATSSTSRCSPASPRTSASTSRRAFEQLPRDGAGDRALRQPRKRSRSPTSTSAAAPSCASTTSRA